MKWPTWPTIAAVNGTVFAWDIAAGAVNGDWTNFALSALPAAGLGLSIHVIRSERRRKTAKRESVVNPNELAAIQRSMADYLRQSYSNYGYVSGGYIGGSVPSPPQPSSPKQPQDFDGVPFDMAVGEVYGLRMWHMDEYGRLRARNWSGAPAWRPGINEAKCVQRVAERIGSFLPSEYSYRVRQDPSHEVPSEGCTCGFYAYTDSLHAETKSNARNGIDPVLGIIKGTGRTLIGTKGFRCEKAEIVAFRDPTRGGLKTEPWRIRQLANLKRVYPDVPILESRAALLEFAPLTDTLPDPASDEFWALP